MRFDFFCPRKSQQYRLNRQLLQWWQTTPSSSYGTWTQWHFAGKPLLVICWTLKRFSRLRDLWGPHLTQARFSWLACLASFISSFLWSCEWMLDLDFLSDPKASKSSCYLKKFTNPCRLRQCAAPLQESSEPRVPMIGKAPTNPILKHEGLGYNPKTALFDCLFEVHKVSSLGSRGVDTSTFIDRGGKASPKLQSLGCNPRIFMESNIIWI